VPEQQEERLDQGREFNSLQEAEELSSKWVRPESPSVCMWTGAVERTELLKQENVHLEVIRGEQREARAVRGSLMRGSAGKEE
jgi:hypothetical protein